MFVLNKCKYYALSVILETMMEYGNNPHLHSLYRKCGLKKDVVSIWLQNSHPFLVCVSRSSKDTQFGLLCIMTRRAPENPRNLQNVYSNDPVNPPVNISCLKDTWKIKLNLNSSIIMKSDEGRDPQIKLRPVFRRFCYNERC